MSYLLCASKKEERKFTQPAQKSSQLRGIPSSPDPPTALDPPVLPKTLETPNLPALPQLPDAANPPIIPPPP